MYSFPVIILCGNIIILFCVQNYLESLHDRYETWLGKTKNHGWHKNAPVIVSLIVANPGMQCNCNTS